MATHWTLVGTAAGRRLRHFNTLIGAGFVLKQLEEPRASEEYCQAHPSQRGWRDHAAVFLQFLAEKPA